MEWGWARTCDREDLKRPETSLFYWGAGDFPEAELRGVLSLSNKSLSNRQLAEGLVSALAEYNAGKELKLKAWSEYREQKK